MIITSSVDAVHGEFEIVHRSVAVPGTANPVKPVVGEDGVTMVAMPETNYQTPVPTAGALPAKVAMPTPHVRYKSEPAEAVVGGALTVIGVEYTAAAEPQALLAVNV